MALVRDEEVQKQGLVVVNISMGEGLTHQALSVLKLHNFLRSGIPKKFFGVHYCYSDPTMQPFVAGIRMCMDKEMRQRFCAHHGNQEEIDFMLKTYGIPTQDSPLHLTSQQNEEHHHTWIRMRRIQEEQSLSNAGVLIPRRFDVLFGRGRDIRVHTGNLRAAHLVEMHQAEYEKATKSEKTNIAGKIVTMVHESRGRFLKWEETGWLEVGDSLARDKISHFFRHLRSRTSASSSCDAGITEGVKRITPCVSPTNFHVEESQLTKQQRVLETM